MRPMLPTPGTIVRWAGLVTCVWPLLRDGMELVEEGDFGMGLCSSLVV